MEAISSRDKNKDWKSKGTRQRDFFRKLNFKITVSEKCNEGFVENETEEQARAQSWQAWHGKDSLSQHARGAQMLRDVNSWRVGGTGSTKTMGNTRSNLNEFLTSGFPETFKMPKVVMGFQKEKL